MVLLGFAYLSDSDIPFSTKLIFPSLSRTPSGFRTAFCFHWSKRPRPFGPKDCGLWQRARCARTFASREEFFPRRMSSKKTDFTRFRRLRAAKLRSISSAAKIKDFVPHLSTRFSDTLNRTKAAGNAPGGLRAARVTTRSCQNIPGPGPREYPCRPSRRSGRTGNRSGRSAGGGWCPGRPCLPPGCPAFP